MSALRRTNRGRRLRLGWATDSLFRPVDASWLAAFRVLFGLLMAVSMLRFLAYGWVDRLFIQPSFHFKYSGFSWVEPLGSSEMHALFWCLLALALCVSAGLYFRFCALLFACGLTYVQLIDVATYLNHYYLAALLSWLLAFSPAHRMWSIDAWLFRRFVAHRAATVSRIWLLVFRYQIGLVYVFAGLAKLNADWLLHAQPLSIWLGTKTDLPLLGHVFTWPYVPLLMSWAGFLFDSTIVVWLSLRRTRIWAYLVVIGFHAMTNLLFDIGMFPFIMTVCALVFFEPNWPKRLLSRFGSTSIGVGSPPSPADASTVKRSSHNRIRRLWLLPLAAYALVQLVLPLRFIGYPGNLLWHEQGMRFSWRVMLRAKGGNLTYLVEDEDTGRTLRVDPTDYLADWQVAELVSQPDLILQLAHYIGNQEFLAGHHVRIRAESRISLNGRRSAVFVDPEVNLLEKSPGLAPIDWLLPPPSTAPHHTRPVL